MARRFTKNTSNILTLTQGGLNTRVNKCPAISVSAWVRPTGTFSTASATSDGLFALSISTLGRVCLKTDASGNLGSSTRAYYFDTDQVAYTGYRLPTGIWTHVAMSLRFSRRGVVYHANGRQVGLTAAANWSRDFLDTTTSGFADRIGAGSAGTLASADQFDGDISDLCVWLDDLRADDCSRLYQEIDPRCIGRQLLAYFPLAGSGAEEVNIVSGASRGTVTGSLPLVDSPNSTRWCTATVRSATKPAAAGGRTASSSITFDGQTASGTGTVSISGTSSVAFAGQTASGTGSVAVSAASSQTFAGQTSTGAASVAISAASSVQLGDMTTSGTAVVGSPPVTASSSVTFDAMATSGSGTVIVSGSSGVVFDGMTTAGAGSVRVSGASSVTFGNMTTSGTAVVGNPPIVCNSSITFDGQAASATGAIRVSGSSSVTFGDMSTNGAGSVSVSGASSITFAGQTASGAASVRVAGASSIQFADMATASAGGVRVAGASSQTFADMTTIATATVGGGPSVESRAYAFIL